jgi:hypothetical protein
MTAYKKPIGAVVKNKTKAMQKSNKLLNKGMRLVCIINYFLEYFQLEKSSASSAVAVCNNRIESFLYMHFIHLHKYKIKIW